MIPKPHNPFSDPYSEKSDPLIGPIFMPLNQLHLDERDKIFNDFREGIDTDRLFLVQELQDLTFSYVKSFCHSVEMIYFVCH